MTFRFDAKGLKRFGECSQVNNKKEEKQKKKYESLAKKKKRRKREFDFWKKSGYYLPCEQEKWGGVKS